MKFPQDQIDELKLIYPNVLMAEEGGITYFFLPDLDMPKGCMPEKVDALFSPMNCHGYNSRLFFAEIINGCPKRNWNGKARILDKTWIAISWNINQNQRLVQMISSHLDAFRS